MYINSICRIRLLGYISFNILYVSLLLGYIHISFMSPLNFIELSVSIICLLSIAINPVSVFCILYLFLYRYFNCTSTHTSTYIIIKLLYLFIYVIYINVAYMYTKPVYNFSMFRRTNCKYR